MSDKTLQMQEQYQHQRNLDSSKLSLDNVYKASYKLKGVIRNTDLIPADAIFPGENIYIKRKIYRKQVLLK